MKFVKENWRIMVVFLLVFMLFLAFAWVRYYFGANPVDHHVEYQVGDKKGIVVEEQMCEPCATTQVLKKMQEEVDAKKRVAFRMLEEINDKEKALAQCLRGCQ